jgi:hypothetical protein
VLAGGPFAGICFSAERVPWLAQPSNLERGDCERIEVLLLEFVLGFVLSLGRLGELRGTAER